MNKDRFKFRLPFYNNDGEFSHFQYIDIVDGLKPYNAGVMFHRGEYEQCTGLIDKNDNLIYEGDIVGFYVYEQDGNWYGGKGAVVWYNSSLGIETSIGFICFENNIPMANPQGIEIIGNIHEQAKQRD